MTQLNATTMGALKSQDILDHNLEYFGSSAEQAETHNVRKSYFVPQGFSALNELKYALHLYNTPTSQEDLYFLRFN